MTAGHPVVRGSARALPVLGLSTAAAVLVTFGFCVHALLAHPMAWHGQSLAFVGGVIGLAGVLCAGARVVVLIRSSAALARALDGAPRLPGHPDVLLVADPRPRAWCAGLLFPQIAVTDAAVTLLSPSALAAVLAHERHHAQRRDALRQGVADAIAAGLFLLPIAMRACERYGALLEHGADRAASLDAVGERGLASAILTLDAPGTGVDPDRVDRLLGRPVRVQLASWTLTTALSLLAALVLIVIALVLATGIYDIFTFGEEDASRGGIGAVALVVLIAGPLAYRVGQRRTAVPVPTPTTPETA